MERKLWHVRVLALHMGIRDIVAVGRIRLLILAKQAIALNSLRLLVLKLTAMLMMIRPVLFLVLVPIMFSVSVISSRRRAKWPLPPNNLFTFYIKF
ncbi:hypothetical protein Peur_002310 [Populus x canadensis]